MSKVTKLDLNKELPAATAEKFEVVGTEKQQSTRIYFPKYGVIDFKTLSVKRAEFLVNAGAPFLKAKKQKDAAGSDKSGK